jgi:hypothetical protein
MKEWRKVVSVSISERNADAMLVAERCADLGIPIGRSGRQILAWAALYLSGATAQAAIETVEPGMSDADLDAALDDF